MSANLPPDYNPYASPAAAPEQRSSVGAQAPGENLRWLYLTSAAISAPIYVVGAFWEPLGLTYQTAHVLVSFDASLGLVRMVLACMWIHAAWSSIPVWWRAGITPGSAVGRFFIPLYNLYWAFDVNAFICRETNRTLTAANQPERAPLQLAYFAMVLHVASNLMAFGSSTKPLASLVTIPEMALWFVYMTKCDVARRVALRFQTEEEADDGGTVP